MIKELVFAANDTYLVCDETCRVPLVANQLRVHDYKYIVKIEHAGIKVTGVIGWLYQRRNNLDWEITWVVDDQHIFPIHTHGYSITVPGLEEAVQSLKCCYLVTAIRDICEPRGSTKGYTYTQPDWVKDGEEMLRKEKEKCDCGRALCTYPNSLHCGHPIKGVT